MHQERSQDDQKHPKTDLEVSKRSPQGVQGFQNETIRGPNGSQREPRVSTADHKRPKGTKGCPNCPQQAPRRPPKSTKITPRGPRRNLDISDTENVKNTTVFHEYYLKIVINT